MPTLLVDPIWEQCWDWGRRRQDIFKIRFKADQGRQWLDSVLFPIKMRESRVSHSANHRKFRGTDSTVPLQSNIPLQKNGTEPTKATNRTIGQLDSKMNDTDPTTHITFAARPPVPIYEKADANFKVLPEQYFRFSKGPYLVQIVIGPTKLFKASTDVFRRYRMWAKSGHWDLLMTNTVENSEIPTIML